MEHQSHVTVSVPVSLADAAHTELAKDIKKYGGIIHDAEWQEHDEDPAFNWVETQVVIPIEWIDNSKPDETDIDDSLYRRALFRLPNGKWIIEVTTLDAHQEISVIYE